MKRSLTLALVLLIGLAFATVGFAAEKTSKMSGEVTKIDAAAKTVTVKDKQGEKEFSIADDVKLGVYKAIDEIKAGEKVAVSFVEKEGKVVAKEIKKVVAKAKKAAPKAAAKPAETKPAEAKPAEGAAQ
jgi:Cu/Ag efflux protein CusF